MDAQAIVTALQQLVPGAEYEVGPATDQPTIYVPASKLVETCRALKGSAELGFTLSDITCTDWWPGEPRFEVIYHLFSAATRTRLRMKVRAANDEQVPTLVEVWQGANWMEREVWDMFGVVFLGHPDLRRLLMPEEWEGHPLRKDYPVQIKMPVRIYEPLQVTAEEFAQTMQADVDARGQARPERPQR